jgi:hypothetical protein
MDTDLTELVEIDPTRLDGVKSPASGLPFLIMKSVKKDVDKKGNLNEAPDISNAEAVLRLLAGLIESEARELGAGFWDEVCDIEMLTNAAFMIKCFRNREQMSADGDSIYKSLESAISGRATELGVTNPMSDTASKETDVTLAPDPTTEPTPEAVEKSTADMIAEAVAEAIAKEVAPREETIKGLQDELTALKSKPLPGGPKITGTAVKSSAAPNAEADNFERLSKEVEDRELRRYYADRAREAREASK